MLDKALKFSLMGRIMIDVLITFVVIDLVDSWTVIFWHFNILMTKIAYSSAFYKREESF